MSWTPRGASEVSVDVRPERAQATGRPRVGWRLASGLVLAVALATALGTLGFRGFGHWLIVSERLAPAQVIVVLAGHHPVAATEAAAIYQQGWAPEIWLTRTRADEAEALRRPGIPSTQDSLNLAILRRLKVPASAIRLLSANGGNTADELRSVAAELRRSGGGAVIIVTSKFHTRRARATWHAVVGYRPPVIVRFASADPFDGARWWRDPRETRIVSHEIFGLLNVWAGLPVRPNGGK